MMNGPYDSAILSSNNRRALIFSTGFSDSPPAMSSAATSESTHSGHSSVSSGSWKGVALGLLAAISYSVTNLALRSWQAALVELPGNLWISGTKAFPTALIASVLLVIAVRSGKTVIPGKKVVGVLIVSALLMQFGGNLGFQVSLKLIGLAISVPIVFASLIVSGAVAGRTILGDAVSIRTFISMGLMVVSIGFLSAAAHSTDSSSNSDLATQAADAIISSRLIGPVTLGVIVALISGLSYGLCGVVIRRVVRGQVPVATTLFIFSLTGLLTLCPISLAQLGFDGISRISNEDWIYILAAGTFNALGFFAITYAYRLMNISRANVVNASQNAMCAAGAWLFFQEPLTAWALIGIGLTIIGLVILD